MPTLDWLTRAEDLKRASSIPYRLLEADPELSAGDPASGNMLIQGDNLDAIKSLLPYYRGQVKCIYIDPPYNTRSAFEHYDDNLEHSQWLAMIYPRLELLRELLNDQGSIWASIDDNEYPYLRVVLDELFGRSNFITTVIWEKRKSRENRRTFSFKHDYVVAYAKSRPDFEKVRNPVPLSDAVLSRYRNPDNDPRGPWQSVAITAQAGHGTPNQFYDIKTPSGRVIKLPTGNCWRFTQPRLNELIEDGRIWFGETGNNVPRQKKFLSESEDAGLTPETIWYADDVGTNDTATRYANELFPGVGFSSPKPEELIQRVLHIASNKGDLVLDSFLGSGTTAAVAHKMNRNWIGVEMGDHAVTHCAPRLKKVIAGEGGGISQAVEWEGGGGFTFYRLVGEVFDANGRIRAGINFDDLAAHIWFSETGAPRSATGGPFLGIHDGKGYALLYNGVLGDKRPNGGNVLTSATLAKIRDATQDFAGPITVYGEASRLGPSRLKEESVTFKQTPYDVKAR